MTQTVKDGTKQNFRTPEYHPSKNLATRPKQQPKKQPPSKPPLPRLTNEFIRNCYDDTATIYLLHPPTSLSTALPSIIAADNSTVLRHPLTLKPFPIHNLNISKFNSTTLTVSHHTPSPFHKLLVDDYALLGLYNDGELRGCIPYSSGKKKEKWVGLMRDGYVSCDKFDDILTFNGNIYALDNQGNVFVVSVNTFPRPGVISVSDSLVEPPLDIEFGWRKRLVIDGTHMYLVVREEEELFRVYKRGNGKGSVTNWVKVEGFHGRKVLFMSSEYYFFMRAEEKFPGSEYENCIVFHEEAFLRYGGDSWEITQTDDDIAFFRLSDGTFAGEGQNEEFPVINWSPPSWISHDSSQSERYSIRSCHI